jgi:hypothetical protein
MLDIGSGLLLYTGQSMNPTFIFSDALCIVPRDGVRLSRGDVVVFHSPVSGQKVVHRIVSRDAGGFMTRGDGNRCIDAWRVRPDQVMGRVSYIERGPKRIKVYGGHIGMLYSGFVRVRRCFARMASNVLGPLYRKISKISYLGELAFVKKSLRYSVFERPYGKEFHVSIRQFLIARGAPDKDRWQIKRPFRILIDPKTFEKKI